MTQGAGPNYKNLLSEQVELRFREALGRSRGGLTTKIHLAANQRCRPVAFITSEGQRHDSIAFETVLGLVSIDRPGSGWPRTRPDWVLADIGVLVESEPGSSRWARDQGRDPDQGRPGAGPAQEGFRGWLAAEFRQARYRDRNTVERSVNKLRGCRATATRYEKRNFIYLGTIAVTSIWIWLRNAPTNIVRHGLVGRGLRPTRQTGQ